MTFCIIFDLSIHQNGSATRIKTGKKIMRQLVIIVDQENDRVTTRGMWHSVKGYVDGNISLEEAGITPDMDRDEIEEFLREEWEDQYEVEIIFK